MDTQTAKVICSAKTDLPLTSSIKSILDRTHTPVPSPSESEISTSFKPLAKKPNDQDWRNGPRKAMVTTKEGKILLTKINFIVIPLKWSSGFTEINSSEILSLKVDEDLPPNQCRVTVTRWDGKSISGTMTKSAIWGQSEFGKWTGKFGLSHSDGGVYQLDIIRGE